MFTKRKKIKLKAPGLKGDMSEIGSQIGDSEEKSAKRPQMEVIQSESSSYNSSRSNSIRDRAEREMQENERKTRHNYSANLPENFKKWETYDPMKFLDDWAKRHLLKEELKLFQSDLDRMIKDNDVKCDPADEIKSRSKALQQEKFYHRFAKEHEKKIIRNIKGIERVSKISIKKDLLGLMDKGNPYWWVNAAYYS